MKNKIMNIVKVVYEWIGTHWAAMITTTMVINIALCNPFVVDRFQTMYKYHVTPMTSLLFDVLWTIMAIFSIYVDHYFVNPKE